MFFLRLLPPAHVEDLPALRGGRFHQRLFTPMVTLWYLVFQRLNHDHTLQAAVFDASGGGADALNGKLSEGILSTSTCSFSLARQRLPLEALAQALRMQGRKIVEQSSGALWRGLVPVLLDGTTVRMRPHGDIPKSFPAHGNQHPERAYWCLTRTVVGLCAVTGAALDCEMDSMRVCEQVMSCRIILRCPTASVFIGDRNFGVFRVLQAVRHAGQQALVRLTRSRAAKLLGRRLEPGDYKVIWSPSRHDQLEPHCQQEPLEGRLLVARLERPGFETEWLYLFATLCDNVAYPAADLVELYGRRWHIELNLRYLKSQMDLAQLEARSADMARKEWLAGLLGYNLVRAAMLCAALRKGSSPLRLSFSGSRRCLERWLRCLGSSKPDAVTRWERTLDAIGRCESARREKPRPSEPRAQRHLRASYPPLYGSRAEARQKLLTATTKS